MLTDDIILNKINQYVDALPFDRKPNSLYEPIRYVLSIGGKRISLLWLCWPTTCLKTTLKAYLHLLVDWKPTTTTRSCTTI